MLFLRGMAIVLMALYLAVQAKSDAKTGMVLWWLNAAALALSFLLWVVATAVCLPPGDWAAACAQAALLALLLWMSTFNKPFIKIMQPADAKAFMAVYLSSSFTVGPAAAPAMLLLTLLLGHSAFLVWHRVIKKCRKWERKPYFPFILLGFLLAGAICIPACPAYI